MHTKIARFSAIAASEWQCAILLRDFFADFLRLFETFLRFWPWRARRLMQMVARIDRKHKHKLFGPLALGTTPGMSQDKPGLSLGQTHFVQSQVFSLFYTMEAQFVPGTNPVPRTKGGGESLCVKIGILLGLHGMGNGLKDGNGKKMENCPKLEGTKMAKKWIFEGIFHYFSISGLFFGHFCPSQAWGGFPFGFPRFFPHCRLSGHFPFRARPTGSQC